AQGEYRGVFPARGIALCAGRLDRREQDEDRLRDPADPAFLRLRAAATAAGDRSRHQEARRRDPVLARRDRGVRHRPYQLYKPSGIDWLGDVPEHWKPRRLRETVQLI